MIRVGRFLRVLICAQHELYGRQDVEQQYHQQQHDYE